MAIAGAPDGGNAGRCPRLFDIPAANIPLSIVTIQSLENDPAAGCQMIGDETEDLRAILERGQMRHWIVGEHDQVERRCEGESAEIGGHEACSWCSSGRMPEHFDEEIDADYRSVPAQHLGDAARSASELQNPGRAPAGRHRFPERKIAAAGERV